MTKPPEETKNTKRTKTKSCNDYWPFPCSTFITVNDRGTHIGRPNDVEDVVHDLKRQAHVVSVLLSSSSDLSLINDIPSGCK